MNYFNIYVPSIEYFGIFVSHREDVYQVKKDIENAFLDNQYDLEDAIKELDKKGIDSVQGYQYTVVID